MGRGAYIAWQKLTKEQRRALPPEAKEIWLAAVRAWHDKCTAKKRRWRERKWGNPEPIKPIVERVMADIVEAHNK